MMSWRDCWPCGLTCQQVQTKDALARYLSEKGAPWTLDEEHMRRRILRRLILDIADPALVIRHLMAE